MAHTQIVVGPVHPGVGRQGALQVRHRGGVQPLLRPNDSELAAGLRVIGVQPDRSLERGLGLRVRRHGRVGLPQPHLHADVVGHGPLHLFRARG